jgi:hypothetical protein
LALLSAAGDKLRQKSPKFLKTRLKGGHFPLADWRAKC